jgi:transposase
MCVREYTYAYAAVDVLTGEMDSLILPFANTNCMQLFLDEVSRRHLQQNIIMVVDGASRHRALTLAVPANIQLLSLPPYAPELNPVEHLWDELREKFFHNRVFNSLSALEHHLADALLFLENNQNQIQSIVSWKWIISSLLI